MYTILLNCTRFPRRCLAALSVAILDIVTIGRRGWLCGCTRHRSLLLLLLFAFYCFHLRSGAATATTAVSVGTIATAICGRGLVGLVLLRRCGRGDLDRLLLLVVAPICSCLLVKVCQVFVVIAEGVVFISRTGPGSGDDDGAGDRHRYRICRLLAGIDGRLQLVQHQLNSLLRGRRNGHIRTALKCNRWEQVRSEKKTDPGVDVEGVLTCRHQLQLGPNHLQV